MTSILKHAVRFDKSIRPKTNNTAGGPRVSPSNFLLATKSPFTSECISPQYFREGENMPFPTSSLWKIAHDGCVVVGRLGWSSKHTFQKSGNCLLSKKGQKVRRGRNFSGNLKKLSLDERLNASSVTFNLKVFPMSGIVF